MEKKDLVRFLNTIFLPIGFKRKGNNWVINGTELNKIVNLQKSQYSNSFYLNYGYVINNLPLKGFVNHICNRLADTDKNKQIRITDLLNLDKDMDPPIRSKELAEIINEKIVTEMKVTNTEADLLIILQRMKYRYAVPPFVLEHFKLSVED